MKKDSALIRLVRLSKWLILFAALASFASISALYIVVSPKWVEEKLEDFSSKKLDLHIKLDGQITIKHLPKIEVTLPKGTLTDTTDNSYLGSFSSGTIRISPWGLLIGSAPYFQHHAGRAEFRHRLTGSERAPASIPVTADSGHGQLDRACCCEETDPHQCPGCRERSPA